MAIQLFLRSINEMTPALSGLVTIISGWLGAIRRIKHLPPHRIPSRCKHSGIFKNILVSCSDLTFQRVFEHVDAHQDDWGSYESLIRPKQLNCLMDGKAKQEIWNVDLENLPRQEAFPLESLCVFHGKEKMSSETGARIRFWVHKQRADEVFKNQNILLPDKFK